MMPDVHGKVWIPEATVYYESWQMDCCGTPFRISDQIDLAVEKFDYEITGGGLPGLPRRAEYRYAGHEDFLSLQQYSLQGKVRKIFLEYSTFRKEKAVPCPNPPFYVESEGAWRFMPKRGNAQCLGFVIVVSDARIEEENS